MCWRECREWRNDNGFGSSSSKRCVERGKIVANVPEDDGDPVVRIKCE